LQTGTVSFTEAERQTSEEKEGFVMSTLAPQRPAVSSTVSKSGPAAAAALTRRRSGFWAVAFAFLIVMAFATLPSPLYGL
jgi:hypothetical protein